MGRRRRDLHAGHDDQKSRLATRVPPRRSRLGFRSSYDGVHFHCGWTVRTTVVLSSRASRHTSVPESLDRELFNSVEQTFTVVVVSFMVAPTDQPDANWIKGCGSEGSGYSIRYLSASSVDNKVRRSTPSASRLSRATSKPSRPSRYGCSRGWHSDQNRSRARGPRCDRR